MATTTKTTYLFTLTLSGDEDDVNDKNTDALFEAGCDDALFGARCGVLYLNFAREAESLGDAIGSAVKDAEKAGMRVVKVEIR